MVDNLVDRKGTLNRKMEVIKRVIRSNSKGDEDEIIYELGI